MALIWAAHLLTTLNNGFHLTDILRAAIWRVRKSKNSDDFLASLKTTLDSGIILDMGKSLNEMTDEERWQLFPIILCEHKAVWKRRYLKEEALLRESIGSQNIKRISHIGSTAVPGLLSKPTIDILVEINRRTDTAKLINNMKRLGYKYLEQPDNPPPHVMFLKGYTERGFKGQAFHVHVRYSGDWDELYFRDYLLSHPETCEKYGKLKHELQQKYEHNRDAYTDAKTDFIKQVCILARDEAKKSKLSLQKDSRSNRT